MRSPTWLRHSDRRNGQSERGLDPKSHVVSDFRSQRRNPERLDGKSRAGQAGRFSKSPGGFLADNAFPPKPTNQDDRRANSTTRRATFGIRVVAKTRLEVPKNNFENTKIVPSRNSCLQNMLLCFSVKSAHSKRQKSQVFFRPPYLILDVSSKKNQNTIRSGKVRECRPWRQRLLWRVRRKRSAQRGSAQARVGAGARRRRRAPCRHLKSSAARSRPARSWRSAAALEAKRGAHQCTHSPPPPATRIVALPRKIHHRWISEPPQNLLERPNHGQDTLQEGPRQWRREGRQREESPQESRRDECGPEKAQRQARRVVCGPQNRVLHA